MSDQPKSNEHELNAQGARGDGGFVHVGTVLGGVLKEVARRTELRFRLEAELGKPLSDEEFLAIADRTGMRI